MSRLKICDKPIAFQRPFVDITGSVTGALLLSQATYWQLRCKQDDGWWWKTQEDWTEETGMKRYELDQAKKACAAFLETKQAGIPCRTWYKVNEEALFQALELSNALYPSSMSRIGKVGCKGQTDCPADDMQTPSTESTSETTTESTAAVEEEGKTATAGEVREQEFVLKAESSPPRANSLPPSPLAPEVVFWNANCGPLPKVLGMSAARIRSLMARRKDAFWMAHYQVAVKRVAESDFCRGNNQRQWKARFDWMLLDGVVAKIMEGTYDNRGGPVRPAPTGEKDILLAALR